MGMSEYFAAWHRDEAVRRKSTSGGAFMALAEYTLSKGGAVVGAAYDDRLNVHHILVESEEGLCRLRGVKYVHGHLGREIYEGIDGCLKSGRKVLFTGLPCQAAAIRARFGLNDNLLIADLVCFGSPRHELWRKYVDWKESRRGRRLIYIDPRDKAKGWSRETYWRYDWDDGKTESVSSACDPYAHAFYTAMAFGAGCFHCPFKGSSSKADITLGDGWGIEQYGEEKKKLGVSCVILHTDKGREAFRKSKLEYRPVDEELILENNFPVAHVATKPKEWEEFQQAITTMSFDEMIRRFHLLKTNADRISAWIHGIISLLLPDWARRLRHG